MTVRTRFGSIRNRVVLVLVLAVCMGVSVGLWAQERRAAPAAPPNVKVLRDLEYAQAPVTTAAGLKKLLIDLYLPTDLEGPMPVAVWIHGGAWQNGSKDNPQAMGLSRRGYAVASISYRFAQEAVFPAQITDCKAAIRWLRAHAKEHNLDPDRIGVWGASAGGHLVALLGTSGDVKELEGDEGNAEYSSRVQAVCDFFGPTDFLQFDPNQVSVAYRQATSMLVGGRVLDHKDKVTQANPITWITKDDPPFLIVHGDQDKVVPYQQSELLAAALEKAGVPVTLQIVKDGPHGVMTPELFRMVNEFFDANLKAAKKTP